MTSIFTLIAFIAGFILACVLLGLKKLIAKRNRESEIEFLQFERDHRELIRDSKIHRDRVAKRSIFSALLLLGILLVITLAVPSAGFTEALTTYDPELPPNDPIYARYLLLARVKVFLWALYSGYVYFLWRRYANINSHQKFLYKIDAKMIKARKNLQRK